ncbi:MAG: aldo/keto reductase [Steroidobacteraceae bacterium]
MNRRELMGQGVALGAALALGGVTARAAAATTSTAGTAPILRAIPSTGETLPVIGLGTSGPFEVGTDAAARAPLTAVLGAFFDGGATLIDTSPMYSTAEGVLGDLLTPVQQRRAFIATKVWTRGEQEGIAQMTRSMQLLKRERVELMQVHNLLDLDTHLRTLRRWKEEGRIRYIGITHFTVAAQPEVAAIVEREKLDFVQINYSATTPQAAERLLPLCADRGVGVLVNRAFDDGKVFSTLRGRPLPGFAAEIGCTSWAQLLLKYVIAHPAVTCVIPATGKVVNLRDNLAAGHGALPDADLQRRIAAAVTG